MDNKYRKLVKEVFGFAGIEINGSNAWDIQIHNESFYKRAIREAELGVGESYMDGWWDAERVDELMCKILRAQLEEKIHRKFSMTVKLFATRAFNLQSKQRSFIVGEKHYDLGNDLFQKMLDKRMTYSCAYWNTAADLDEAQENKLDLICRKLYLKPGLRVLDIGCGWGSFGKYAAEKYNVEVVGITVSKEQVELGRKLCEGFPVEFQLIDYRDMNEQFDRIVSIGMFEHVGYKNYRTFFKIAQRCLKDDGLFLLHTIGRRTSVKTFDAWMHKYIFPNSMLPSAAQLSKSFEDLFVMEDWHNFGVDYDKTLMAWYDNFSTAWDTLKSQYSDRFFRMWKYFLLTEAGAFRARRNQVWQIVLSKDGIIGGYQSAR